MELGLLVVLPPPVLLQLFAVIVVWATGVRSSSSKVEDEEAVFNFLEFDYMETPKTETAFKEWEAACLQTPACLGLEPIIKLKCVRKCMSPSCYHDLYAFDELEEGEIDIRFQSFKGCFAQRIHKRRL